MRLWDLVQRHTQTGADIIFILYLGGGKESYPMDLIPYACLVEKISMWELETSQDSQYVQFKVWLGEQEGEKT